MTTIQEESTGFYKEKGSKFLAFAYPVENETEIKEKLNVLRKKYYDATHHCYAYILGEEQENYRVSDDGEPAHSAGIPIWGQLRAFKVTDVLVVVVRYYGGINLGMGGLMSAYKTSASLALQDAKIIEKIVFQNFELCFDYLQMNNVMKCIKEFEGKITQQNADPTNELHCKISVSIEKKNAIIFIEKIKDFRL